MINMHLFDLPVFETISKASSQITLPIPKDVKKEMTTLVSQNLSDSIDIFWQICLPSIFHWVVFILNILTTHYILLQG